MGRHVFFIPLPPPGDVRFLHVLSHADTCVEHGCFRAKDPARSGKRSRPVTSHIRRVCPCPNRLFGNRHKDPFPFVPPPSLSRLNAEKFARRVFGKSQHRVYSKYPGDDVPLFPRKLTVLCTLHPELGQSRQITSQTRSTRTLYDAGTTMCRRTIVVVLRKTYGTRSLVREFLNETFE